MKRVSEPRARLEPRHPIALVSARTGLSQDVLRVWERRYKVVKPGRDEDGQRLYSDADVERLRLLQLATSAGRAISRVATMSDAELAALLQEDRGARSAELATIPRILSDSQRLIDDAIACVRAFDGFGLHGVLRRACARSGVASFVEQVAAPFLTIVAEETQARRLNGAQLKLADVGVAHFAVGVINDFTPRPAADTMVVATPAGERQATGAALTAAWSAAAGWNVVYLGADLTAKDIATSAIATRATAVAVSIILVDDVKRLTAELRDLRALLPAGTALLAGGAGAVGLEKELTKLGVRVCADFADFDVATPDLTASAQPQPIS